MKWKKKDVLILIVKKRVGGHEMPRFLLANKII